MSGSFVQRGQDLVDRGEHLEAVKVCRLGLLASPTEVAGRLVLATALGALRRHDEVLAEMRVALELEPNNAQACALKGEALLAKGDALQAREILDRARQLDPADPTIERLLDDANAALGGVGKPRRGAAGLVDDQFDSHTKHYPAHAGAAAGPLDPDSGHVTEPHTPAAEDDTVRSERYDPLVDRSGTIELHPMLEAMDTEQDAPLADPPELDEDSGIVLDTEDVELMTDSQVAMIPDAPTRTATLNDDSEEPTDFIVGRGPSLAPGPTHRHAPAPRKPAPGPGIHKPLGARRTQFPDEPSEPTVAESPRARGRNPEPAARDIHVAAPAVDHLFRDDDYGASSSEVMQPPVSGAIDTPPSHEVPGQPVWVPDGDRDDDGPDVFTSAQRGWSEDMEVIKQGLGLENAPPPPKRGHAVRRRERTRVVGERSPRGARGAPRPQRKSPLLIYAVVVVVVIAGAVFAGLKVRDARLQRQVERAMRDAARLAAADTYRGYLRAADAYARILDARADDGTEAALARTEAAIAAEFGDRRERAAELVGKLGSNTTADAHAARVYLALATGDLAAARTHSSALTASYPDSPLASYLAGRTELLAGDAEAAVGHLQAALATRPSPATYVGLGVAHHAAGQYAEALAALDSGLALSPGHPAATIERARVQVDADQLPAPGQPETDLEGVIAEGRRPIAEQRIGASRQQIGWAGLALAEVALARGKRLAAKTALGDSVASRPLEDWRYSEALSAVYLYAGDLAGARAEAERAANKWPARAGSHVRLAQVALLGADPAGALDALAAIEAIDRRPEALAVRGRARLVLNDVDGAAADLDAALAARPGARDAQIARAEVDLRRGDPRGAVSRLKPLYEIGTSGEIGIVYASALRRSGERERARRVLEDALAEDKTSAAHLELARLDRDEGKFRNARARYAKAIESDPDGVDARLEAAELALDVGDAPGAREALDRLATDAPDVGRVLVAAARVRTITGDPVGAGDLLDSAEALVTTPKWILGRELGRILLRTQRPKEAIGVLERAVALQPDDGEARILLVDAYLTAEDGKGAQKALTNTLKRFAARAEANLALGRVHLFNDRVNDAMAAFKKARRSLVRANAPPRELSSASFWIGRVYYYSGKTKQARGAFGAAVKLDPGNADAHFFLGQIQYDAERHKDAVAAFDRSIAADPVGNPLAYFFKGESALRLRRKSLAKAALETYIELVPKGDLVPEAKLMLKRL